MHLYAGSREMLGKPAAMPCLQVTGSHDEESILSDAHRREVTHEAAGMREHRCEADAADIGDPAGQHLGQTPLGLRPADLVLGEGGNVEDADGTPGGATFAANTFEGIGTPQAGSLDGWLTGGREIQRYFHPIADAEYCMIRLVVGMNRRGLRRSAGGPVFIGVRDLKASRIEFARFRDAIVSGCVWAEAGDVHGEHVAFRLPARNPLR